MRCLLITLTMPLTTSMFSVASERVAFVGVALDQESREADQKLQEYLIRKADVRFAPENLEYGRVIQRLANWKDEEGPYVARTTPYVLVAAEMLGADLETLATYVSSTTGSTTYHSYLVVNRHDVPAHPDLTDILRFVTTSSERPRFVYHSKFSTSSFFLPSLYLRAHKIFHMPESTTSLTAISSSKTDDGSSSRLVELVAQREADLAAVWDGTMAKFTGRNADGNAARLGRKVHFVRLPTALPNDLLVCSSSLDQRVKDALVAAIRAMGSEEMAVGDFKTWRSFRQAPEARLALAELRWLAKVQAAPITVDQHVAGFGTTRSAVLEAARQAVRLSGTELVPYDEDFYEHIDYSWTIEEIHDGALKLTSTIPGSEVPDQVFRISFQSAEDLTQRIVSLIHSRLHRIRYAWPYSEENPTVIRDIAFELPEGAVVKVQRISWLDLERNRFRAGPLFEATILHSDFSKYVLDVNDFPNRATMDDDLDAMSNVAYRVLLLRSSEEAVVFKLLTGLLVLLLVAAAVASLVALRRSVLQSSPSGTSS